MTSPIIGAVLMIGVTVSLASFAALMITGPPSELAMVDAYAQGMEFNGQGVDVLRVVLSHASPTTVPANALTIRYGPAHGPMVTAVIDEPVNVGTAFLLPCTGPGLHTVTLATDTSAPPLNLRCDSAFEASSNDTPNDDTPDGDGIKLDCPTWIESFKERDLSCMIEPFLLDGVN